MFLNKLFIAAQNRYFLLKEEEGQTMAEYGIVLAVITVGVVLALGFLSGRIQTAISAVGSRL